jgi:glycosyltransferase involved in cell wall biosynthesis
MMSIDPRYPLRWMHRLWRISRQLKESGADVVLPFTTWPNVIAGLTYRLAGARVCIWGERACGGERVSGFERAAVWQTRRFAANSSAGVEFLARELRVPRSQISFVPNGVEEPVVDSGVNWRARMGVTPSQPLVVKVATISTFKDHMTLLRAWKQVQDAWKDGERPVLALAGAFYETYEECRRFVSDAALDSTVRFLGRVSEIPELFNACDMGAFSSPAEGMPNSVLECMAAGRAIVGTDLPGVRDALGPGAEGVVIPPRDVDLFARVLLDLLRNPAKRRQLGELNRVRIGSQFSVERMAGRYLDMIRTELAKSPAKTRAIPNSWKPQNVSE